MPSSQVPASRSRLEVTAYEALVPMMGREMGVMGEPPPRAIRTLLTDPETVSLRTVSSEADIPMDTLIPQME